MFSSVRNFVLGSPLPTAEEVYRRLNKVRALAVFSSDVLSSTAYATEEILFVLVVAGAPALGLSLPIALAIALLLVIVASSYYQLIHGYPSGGGAYSVARDNLGVFPGLIAAAGLLIDCTTTVAVSISAGIAAITSAFPALFPFRVGLCLLAIWFITWGNLRGVRESGTLFAAPTYSFIFILFTLIVVGLVRLITGTLNPAPVQTMPAAEKGLEVLTLFLILRAFSSGCAALTGIEAVATGLGAFEKPEVDNASKVLMAQAVLSTTMFLGVTFLARAVHAVPAEQETVVSQIGRQVFGGGPLYLALQAATALILIVAANTSVAEFPRLSAILARDRYLPRQLANLGDRLVFANGIILFAFLTSTLVIVFGGQTHRLIPLYAQAVFLCYTLSQAGMVRYWRREGGQGWRGKATVNGLGAVTTGLALLVIVTTKFARGGWIVILLLPTLVWAFRAIERHYLNVASQLSLEGLKPERKWTDATSHKGHKVVVPVSGMHRATLAALHFARSLSKDVTAVVVDVEPEVTARVRERWPTWGYDVPLVALESPYRSTIGPLLAFLDEADHREPERGLAVVVLPEFVTVKWWQDLFHNQTAQSIKKALIYRRGLTGKDRVIIDIPYHLQR